MAEKKFLIENYGKKSTFASFLPGISGEKGIPIWCYYVNRGQCVVSFGVDNKDHSIMEFYPAHQAYQNVKTTGFRTFVKKDGKVTELFADENRTHRMEIARNGLKIEEENDVLGVNAKVDYFTLPGEKIGALVRRVELTNTTGEYAKIEVLDGMPALIPYGVGIDSMKNMCQTSKAWMQVEDVKEGRPYFRVRASMADTAAVTKMEGGNFSIGCLSDGTRLQPVVDPTVVFSYDTSLQKPIGFEGTAVKELLVKEQITMNQLPCSFYGTEAELAADESICFYEIIGQVENKDLLKAYAAKKLDAAYFHAKAKEADGFIFGSPVYYAHPSGRVLSFLDRLFYSAGSAFAYKPGAAGLSARRGGTTASFDVLNKYFGISNMMTVGSQYWNMVHGNKPEEVLQDLEGLQIMRTLGRNMAWLLHCIQAGKAAGIEHPQNPKRPMTNFIR